MKKLLIIAISIAFIGCAESVAEKKEDLTKSNALKIEDNVDFRAYKFKVDNQEYIVVRATESISIIKHDATRK